jgi:hypothetical protein
VPLVGSNPPTILTKITSGTVPVAGVVAEASVTTVGGGEGQVQACQRLSKPADGGDAACPPLRPAKVPQHAPSGRRSAIHQAC